jgi:3-hydroxybutyryl-CoA dehydrogenase
MSERIRVAVVGAGTMGNGIAHAFAQHGSRGHADRRGGHVLEKALPRSHGNLERQVKKGPSRGAARRDAGAGLIIEAVPENRALKAEILRSLETLRATRSSRRTRRRSPSRDLAAHVARPDRSSACTS